MPRVLAIETSGRAGSIALAEGRVLVAREVFPHGLKHAAEIIPIVDRLCRSRDWSPNDLEHLYVSAGPGSFTGLRIGITLAKTMAFATGVKLVAVPTVRALAENAPAEATHLVIVLDAKRDQIFTARFERMAEGWVEREPAHLDTVAAMIERSPRPVYLLGEGIPFHEKPADAEIEGRFRQRRILLREDALQVSKDCIRRHVSESAVVTIGFDDAEDVDVLEPLGLGRSSV